MSTRTRARLWRGTGPRPLDRAEAAGPIDAFRQFFSLQRDVLVLSLAMFAFSLGFQMTSRFLPEYMVALGASGFVVGLFGTFGNVISAVSVVRVNRHATDT